MCEISHANTYGTDTQDVNKRYLQNKPWSCTLFVCAVLYTADCRSIDESCPLVKFADDIELVGKIGTDEDALYHKQIENFVNWCDKNYLYLNVSPNERDVYWF